MKFAAFYIGLYPSLTASFTLTSFVTPSRSIMTRKITSSTRTIMSSTSLKACSTIPTHLKGVFCGSGSDAMNDNRMVRAVLSLTDKAPEDTNVLYLGTATYDIQGFFVRQTERFVQAGCQVKALRVADVATEDANLSAEERLQHYHELIDNADVLVVGGGNTLFALDRWRKLGLVPALRRAADRGAVLTGGSAGAICWFDAGHSNAADPATFKSIRMKRFANRSAQEIVDEIYAYKPLEDEETDQETDEDEDMSDSDDENKGSSWEYFRVSALGFLPGLVSPHLDRVQSNGVLRANDFDKCLLQHAGENGIGIDHFAALVVDGPNYRVVSLDDKEGTNRNGQFVEDGSGQPAVWIKRVVNGSVQSQLCPPQGQLKDILAVATSVVEDKDATQKCRRANRDDGWVPTTRAIAGRQ